MNAIVVAMTVDVLSSTPHHSAGVRGAAVTLTALHKAYGPRRRPLHAVRDVSLDFERGSFTAVMGPSGSGKSSLLHCAAGLDQPTSGSVRLGDVELSTLSDRALTRLRRTTIGFVFQAYNLLPALTVRQNAVLPLRLARRRAERAWVQQVLAQVGLAERLSHRPAQLSGGQQQRVAIARALIPRPEVVFADEPTGALDTKSGRDVLGLLRDAVDAMGQTVVMVTHDPAAASFADRVVFMADGRLAGEITDPTAAAVAAQLARLGG
jgi:putative ABC transport system ATP-binding protein